MRENKFLWIRVSILPSWLSFIALPSPICMHTNGMKSSLYIMLCTYAYFPVKTENWLARTSPPARIILITWKSRFCCIANICHYSCAVSHRSPIIHLSDDLFLLEYPPEASQLCMYVNLFAIPYFRILYPRL